MLRASTNAVTRLTMSMTRPSSSLLCRRSFTFVRLPSAHAASRVASPTSHTHTLFARCSTFDSVISDPSRPDLFYHPVSLPMVGSAYAVSFLTQPPPTPDSCSVLGWLPAETAGEADAEAGLNDFVENPKFRVIMHEAIQTGLQEKVDDIWINAALQLQQGWMHIHDSRNLPALGRIGDPDDIIASVLVQDSKILPDTYQSMPSYRLCTSDGPTLLTEGLAAKLKLVLEGAIAREVAQ
ncbi:uncharacterized protein F5891DRAFT_1017497 [Suillus fuscotomentosus]|uniref:Uncharacterized protein n=1 Tax=Suillus fuscotomentosus TaxID=1912939 RepID=A0AAD4HNZ6_9AGAM|nr:uncharacterized protein F5891DRAFT_1017497 [Suillus fuscotomentosus]KAG1903628.1 hypothetical protein F5891DRAFT_1017497 [Suillus fuscotomentosus]